MAYRVYLCGVDDGTRVVPNPECPNAAAHTPEPLGYLEWHDWAAQMIKTHKQRACPMCNRLCIWEQRPPKGTARGTKPSARH